jgi:hypothetical protein
MSQRRRKVKRGRRRRLSPRVLLCCLRFRSVKVDD